VSDVFFSYSVKDHERVRRVRDALADKGIDVFFDQQTPAGTDWDTWIRGELAKSKCAVVFWSATSIASQNVRHEAELAKNQRKLIAVLLEPIRALDLPMGLYPQLAANLSNWNGDYENEEWRKFLDQIEAKLLQDNRRARTQRETALSLTTTETSTRQVTGSARIFISYRREDSAGHAGRVHDRLEREFGRELIFMDVDAVPLGVNFVKALREEVAKCDVLLAVIGPTWLDSRDEAGHRRLDNPNDFVRVEVAAALQRQIPVIPILLDGTKIPNAERLPEEMRELALRNGLDVRHSSFQADIDKLIRSLKRTATTSPRNR
jgi:hypothetical protein